MKFRKGSALKPGTIIWIVSGCAFLCLSGIGYVWAKTEVYALGKEMKGLETKLERMQRENEALQRRYAEMCTPRELDRMIRKLNLGLAAPQPNQIVRLRDTPPAAPPGKTSDLAMNHEE